MLLTYNHKLQVRAKDLRNKSTLSEVLLWKYLKKDQTGYRFLRQKIIGNYIVDFYCPVLRLIIEIDGSSHEGKEMYDSFRDKYFAYKGLRMIKFLDADVKSNIEAVVKVITIHTKAQHEKSPF